MASSKVIYPIDNGISSINVENEDNRAEAP
jgi:hypothetical protein